MNRPTQTEAIKNFLKVKTLNDLAELYNENMEVQVIVDEKNGVRTDSEYKGKQFQCYTDGINIWKPIRIPYNSNTEPDYDLSKTMNYDLNEYALGIGLTGWDWKNKISRYVAFDFDAITDHTGRKSLTQDELQKIINLVTTTSWITVRKSTGGNGLHLYVFLDPNNPITTLNHVEHAALARSILNQLSSICSYDFASSVDCAGGNIWIWHRKYEQSKAGFQLIKQGSFLERVQPDWKNHIPVVSGKRSQTLPSDYESDPDKSKLFDQLTGQKIKISLDTQHLNLIRWLEDHGFYVSWDSDRWMLITHTHALKEAHVALNLKGRFETVASGNDKTDRNCFMHPLAKGGWVVRRFTIGASEAITWDQDNAKFTRCFYNVEPDLSASSKIHNGVEDEKGKFNFNNVKDGIKVAQDLGITIDLPPKMEDRKITLRTNQGKLIVEIDRHKDLDGKLEGWIEKPKVWLKVYKLNSNSFISYENELTNYDDTVRHLVSEDSKDLGWVVLTESSWNSEPFNHVKTVLEGHYNYDPKKATNILGSNIIKPWSIINLPFQPEYPGTRIWNRDGAKLRFSPSSNLDSLHYPTWLKLLNHCGVSLDSVVSLSKWGIENGIKTGADYLKCWIASMIQRPFIPLPYLFFYGPQESGKSSFHEALARLLISGYVRADSALRGASNFNGELKGAVLCIIEEIDLGKDKVAYNRIKDWVNTPSLPIHEKFKTPYLVRNTTKWIQSSNNKDFCPIFEGGDTRITMIYVGELEHIIPKDEMMQQLDKEAPDFLAAIKNLELPKVTGRLAIPIMITEDKRSVESANKSSLELFLEEKVFHVPGKYVLYSELFERFKEFLPASEVGLWTINRFGAKLPHYYVKGRIRGSNVNWHIGNISFDPIKINEPKLPRLIKVQGSDYLSSETASESNGVKDDSIKINS